MCRVRKPRQQIRFQPVEYLHRPRRAQRRIGLPAANDLFVECVLHAVTPGIRGKEPLGQIMHLYQPRLDLSPHFRLVASHETGDPRNALGRFRQVMGLGIIDHLDAMLDLPMGPVMARQCFGHVLRHPALLGQMPKRWHRAVVAQFRVAPAGNQLPGLGKELDLANTATPKLHVVPLKRNFAPKPLMLADAQAHVMRVLNGRKIEMLAPNKRSQRLEKPCPRLEITRRGPRLDIGRALPCAPEALVIALCRLHREANRRDRWIRPQAQIRAEHIAIPRQIVEHGRHLTRRTHE